MPHTATVRLPDPRLWQHAAQRRWRRPMACRLGPQSDSATILQFAFSSPAMDARLGRRHRRRRIRALCRLLGRFRARTSPNHFRASPHRRDPRLATHHLDAPELLALGQELYGSLPLAAMLLTVGAGSTELGEEFSDPVEAALPRACAACWKKTVLPVSQLRTGFLLPWQRTTNWRSVIPSRVPVRGLLLLGYERSDVEVNTETVWSSLLNSADDVPIFVDHVGAFDRRPHLQRILRHGSRSVVPYMIANLTLGSRVCSANGLNSMPHERDPAVYRSSVPRADSHSNLR